LKGVEKIALFLLAYHHIPKIFHRNIPKNQEKKNYKQKLIGRRKPENFSEWTNGQGYLLAERVKRFWGQ
jgi:hypothetical protein